MNRSARRVPDGPLLSFWAFFPPRASGVREVWLGRCAKLVVVANGVDAVLTLLWIHLGTATEANPLLAPYATAQPLVFVAAKLALVSLGVLLLLRHAVRPEAFVGLVGCSVLYVGICSYHGWHAARLLSNLA